MNEHDNSMALEQSAPRQMQTTTETATARASQEVQAAMVIAKKFPRDETAAFNRIMRACKRKALAECAAYVYPRGGTSVTGPSIRLAEALAQNWGNLDFGVVELDQRVGESSVMAYAWDLETNTRQTKIFTVPHVRRVKNNNVGLTDPRDIYEMVANQAARRMRACILGVIPGDVVDAAIEQCEQTLKSGNAEPLIDRARKMVGAFGELGVTQAMVEAKLGHKLDALTEQELVNLRKIFTSIKDGASSRDAFFKTEAAPLVKEQKDDDEIPMGEQANGDAMRAAMERPVQDEPQATTTPKPPKDKPKASTPAPTSPQAELAAIVDSISFDDFKSFASITHGFDASSYPSMDDLPTEFCKTVLADSKRLARWVKVFKAGGAK